MAPKAEKKPAKKVAKTAKTGGKKKSKAKVESFKIYIYKVLKQVRLLGCFHRNLSQARMANTAFCTLLTFPAMLVANIYIAMHRGLYGTRTCILINGAQLDCCIVAEREDEGWLSLWCICEGPGAVVSI